MRVSLIFSPAASSAAHDRLAQMPRDLHRQRRRLPKARAPAPLRVLDVFHGAVARKARRSNVHLHASAEDVLQGIAAGGSALLLVEPYAIVVPYSTRLSELSSVFQVIVAEVSLMALAAIPEITGGVISGPAAVATHVEI